MIAHEETIKGYDVKIMHDDDPMNPRVDFDNLGTMVCWHRRYDLGDKHDHKTIQGWLVSLVQEVLGWDAKVNGWYLHELEDYALYDNIEGETIIKLNEILHKYYIVLPISLYDHSGISMSVGSGRGWDYGQVGYIYLSKEDARKEYGWKLMTKKRIAKVEKYLTGEVACYDSYLTGNVYGYTVEKDGENIDSCWGFYGEEQYPSYSYCLTEAKGVVDWHKTREEISQAHEEIEKEERSWKAWSQVPLGAI